MLTGTSIEFQMSLLLFISLLAYYIASRIDQSVVIVDILVGLVIGPSVLNWIDYTDFVASIAHLGAIVLLFVIGLEFKFSGIYKRKYVIIALVGLIIPWIAGYWMGGLFGYDFNTSVFIGTALTATSIAITANVLKELGKLDTDAAKAIIGAAVIDDILSLLALSISIQIVSSDLEVTYIIWVFLKAIIFLVVGSLLGNSIVKKYIMEVDRQPIARRFPETVFVIAMTFAFFYSMIAESIGLSAIVGAFLAGVSLEGIELKNSRSFKEGADYLQIIFAAIFFVSLGILVDIHVIQGYTIILFIIALTVVAILTKVLGCYIASVAQGISHKDSLIIGFGMSPRGEVAMIAGLMGLTSGVISQDIYVTIIMMSLLTTLLTPMVLRNWFYKKET